MCLPQKLTPLIPVPAQAGTGTSGVGWRTGDERSVRVGCER